MTPRRTSPVQHRIPQISAKSRMSQVWQIKMTRALESRPGASYLYHLKIDNGLQINNRHRVFSLDSSQSPHLCSAFSGSNADCCLGKVRWAGWSAEDHEPGRVSNGTGNTLFVALFPLGRHIFPARFSEPPGGNGHHSAGHCCRISRQPSLAAMHVGEASRPSCRIGSHTVQL